MANALLHEDSLYLRQHAHNPVDWLPWGAAAFARAKVEDKPVLLSIGYASCHWCHVMERECFEREDLAALMNADFICIKIDREERPDVDMIYMEAVQMMGLGGGWPLNVFCTPEREPFYGGTYFPPQNWARLLTSIVQAWKVNKAELTKTAANFRQELQAGLRASSAHSGAETWPGVIGQGVAALLPSVDMTLGGMQGAPKFPLPGLWNLFLQTPGQFDAHKAAFTTLSRMAYGGIYDHVGGGFFRYSTDARWFAPHFEKMLYDNAQLLATYAQAYAHGVNIHYMDVMEETVAFIADTLTSPDGAFYASLDADSEGHEGRYYTWTADELRTMLGADEYNVFEALYGLTDAGNWEDGRNILHRELSLEKLARQLGFPQTRIVRQSLKWKEKLAAARAERIPPALDKKILTAWNGLCTYGLAEAYRHAGLDAALQLAQANEEYLRDRLIANGLLLHTANQKTEAYLDGYAAWVLALVNLYEATFTPKYLELATRLADTALARFADGDDPLLFYTSVDAETLIARKKETYDSVIPSSNAMMAEGLARLGLLMDEPAYTHRAMAMVATQVGHLGKGLQHHFHWAKAAQWLDAGVPTIAIVGQDAKNYRRELDAQPLGAYAIAGSATPSDIGMLAGKTVVPGHTMVHVCFGGSCKRPVGTVAEALAEITSLSA